LEVKRARGGSFCFIKQEGLTRWHFTKPGTAALSADEAGEALPLAADAPAHAASLISL